MRRRYVLLALLVLVVATARADDTVWTREWSSGGKVSGRSVAFQGTDVVVSGTVLRNPTTRESDFYIIKYSETGETRWQKVFELDSFGRDPFLSVGPGGELYAVAKAKMRPASAMLLRLSADGDTVWTRTHDSTHCGNIEAVADGCWLFGGLGAPQPRDTLWLGFFDAAGNKTVHKSWRLASQHSPAGLCRTGNGSLYAAATLFEAGQRAALLKFSSTGDTVWTRRLSDSVVTIAVAMAPAEDDDFYLLGLAVGDTPWLVRFGPDAELRWKAPVPPAGAVLAWSLASDTAGNAYVATGTQGGLNVAQFSPEGRVLGMVTGGTATSDVPGGVGVGADLQPVVTGASQDSVAALTVKFIPPSGIAGPVVAPGPGGTRLLGALAGRPRLVVARGGSYRLGLFGADGRELAHRAARLEPGTHELGLAAGRASGVRYLVVEGPAGTARFKLVRAR